LACRHHPALRRLHHRALPLRPGKRGSNQGGDRRKNPKCYGVAVSVNAARPSSYSTAARCIRAAAEINPKRRGGRNLHGYFVCLSWIAHSIGSGIPLMRGRHRDVFCGRRAQLRAL